MDYRTLFISDLTSLVIYTVAVCLLALGNRKIKGLQWFALSLLLCLVKVIFQSLRGLPPLGFTSLLSVPVANAVNGLSFFAMYLGYRGFLLREPFKNWLIPGSFLFCLLLYPGFYFLRSPWAFLVSMLPVIAACLFSAGLMLRQPLQRQFAAVARASFVVLILQILVAGYRTALITDSARSHTARVPVTDPRWLYSMLLLTILDSCYVATYLWFYVIEFQAKLRRQARTDNLTGALNRYALDTEAEREIAFCRRHNLAISLIVLDIDHFKHLNDARGHEAGDVALRAFAGLLTAELRSRDLIARTGGEEFLVLLPETPLYRAHEIAERLRLAIQDHSITFDGLPICITASLGIAELQSNDTWESLRRRGDLAMYTAKRLGRNRVAVQLEPAPILLREASGSLPKSPSESVPSKSRHGAPSPPPPPSPNSVGV